MSRVFCVLLVAFFCSSALCEFVKSDWNRAGIIQDPYIRPSISDNNKNLLLYSGNEIQVLDIANQQELSRVSLKSWNTPRLSPSGAHVAVTSGSKELGVIASNSGKLRKTRYDMHGYRAIEEHLFSSDDRFLVTLNSNPGYQPMNDDKREIAVVDVESQQVIMRLEAKFINYIVTPCVLVAGDCILSTEMERDSKISNRTLLVLRKIPNLEPIKQVQLITSNPGRSASIVGVSKSKKNVVLIEENGFIVVGRDVVIRSLSSFDKIFSFKLNTAINPAEILWGRISHNDRSFVISNDVDFLKVFDLATGVERFHMDLTGDDASRIKDYWFDSSGDILTYATWDGRVSQINLVTKQVAPLFSVGSDVIGFFNLLNTRFLSVSPDGHLSDWSPRSP